MARTISEQDLQSFPQWSDVYILLRVEEDPASKEFDLISLTSDYCEMTGQSFLALLNNDEQEMSKIEGYQQTQRDPKELVEIYKKYYAVFISFLHHDIKFDHCKTFDKNYNGGDWFGLLQAHL